MKFAPSLFADAGATFVHEVELGHPVELVWRSITSKHQVDRYYFSPIGADVGAPGAEIFYGTPARKLITGRIVALDAPRLLQHTFRFAGDTQSPETLVTYRLTGSGERTTLRVEHHGYAQESQGYADIAMGWPIIVDGLAEVLAGRR